MGIVKRIISFTIWAFIALNVVLIGVSHMPSAQRFLGQKVAATLGDLLGTSVSIGRVDLGFLNRIIIDDVVIKDLQQKDMLRASRLSVKMDIMPLMEGRVSISSAQIFGATALFYRQDSLAQANYQFVLDALASNDTTQHSPLNLRINSLIIRHSSIAFDQWDKPITEGLFNPRHLRLSDISGHINLRKLTNDSLNVNIKRLGFREQSGLKVERLSGKLEAGREHALLRELILQMPHSHLQIDTLSADYRLSERGVNPGTLAYSGKISNTNVAPFDLSCFASSLKNLRRQIAIQTDFRGTDQQLTVPHFHVSSFEKDIDINANGWIENWQTNPTWHLQLNHVELAETSIDFLTKNIPQLPAIVGRLGHVQMSGICSRDKQGLATLHTLLQTGIGTADLQLSMDSQRVFEGTVQSDGINLQQLLGEDRLGSIAAQLNLSGQLHDKQQPDIKANGTISRFDYNGYSYRNITLDGNYLQQMFSGSLSIDDPNAVISLEGELTNILSNSDNQQKKVMLHGNVARLIPQALNLTDRWEDAEFSGQLTADFTATNLNDAQGVMRLSGWNATATEHYPAYTLDNLVVSSGYEKRLHFVNLKSDFADATLKGEFDYATLAQSIVNLIGSKLPTLPGLPPVNWVTNNNFSMRLMMSKADWLKRFLDVDLSLKHPLMLTARVNDNTRDIFLDADLPSFVYNGAPYAGGNIHITTPDDTLKCDITLDKLMGDGRTMSANGQIRAAHNQLNTSLNWDNHETEKRISGQLNGIIQLYRNLDNLPEAHLRVQPSHIILNNGTWDVEPSDIIYNKNHLLVDNFMVRRGKQHIIVDGIASKLSHDSLAVDLKDVEVAYILDLVNFHTVEFSGRATGRAVAHSLFDHFGAAANLQVADFKFEDGRMGTLYADVNWNQEEQQIDIHAISKDGPGVNTYIDGYVSPTHNTIDLAFQADSTYIDFMHSFTKSFLSHATGHANGAVRLAGPLNNINLTGKLVVDGEITVEALNTTYYLERDTVELIPDEIELRDLSLHDREGHRASLSGGIHHRHLTNLSFDLAVDAENLLAYDFTDFGESSFYGTVYANGTVTIQGRPNEVIIDCNVTPQKNSVFVYNAANPDAITKQEFIEWMDTGTIGSPSNTSDRQAQAGNRAQAQPVGTGTNIYLNFLVNVNPDATMRLLMDANTNDYITLNGEGAIRATYYNKGAFNMFGTYTVDHGTYGVTIQNIIKKNFTFNRGGTIIFGGDPYNASLNLQAVYTVNGVSLSDLNIGNSFSSNTIRVNCLMNIGGQPNAPQVDFDLEMPNVNADEQQMVRSIINGQQEMNQQVLYLLGIGRFYNQGANNSATDQQADQTSLAMQSLLSGTLSAQINTLLNQLIKNDNWNFGANISTGNEGWHNAEYEGIVNARMLNNRLLLNGQFGYRDNATQATPSFIGDFDLQYLLYPNGNLALKVYNQTNDRYFTKSSLNTQGLGVIMKKDFNGLRDLFSTKKKKRKEKKK